MISLDICCVLQNGHGMMKGMEFCALSPLTKHHFQHQDSYLVTLTML